MRSFKRREVICIGDPGDDNDWIYIGEREMIVWDAYSLFNEFKDNSENNIKACQLKISQLEFRNNNMSHYTEDELEEMEDICIEKRDYSYYLPQAILTDIWRKNNSLINMLYTYIRLCESKDSNKVVSNKAKFEDRIAMARQYPIENLIDVLPGGMAYCPYHNEKSPSVKIYQDQNKGWAYCCQKHVGPIDIVMEKVGCTFKEAVIRLT